MSFFSHFRQRGCYHPHGGNEELKLTNAQKYFIGRLLRLEKPFAGVTEMSNGFIEFMEEGLPAHL